MFRMEMDCNHFCFEFLKCILEKCIKTDFSLFLPGEIIWYFSPSSLAGIHVKEEVPCQMFEQFWPTCSNSLRDLLEFGVTGAKKLFVRDPNFTDPCEPHVFYGYSRWKILSLNTMLNGQVIFIHSTFDQLKPADATRFRSSVGRVNKSQLSTYNEPRQFSTAPEGASLSVIFYLLIWWNMLIFFWTWFVES